MLRDECPSAERVAALVTNGLCEAERTDIANHAAWCERCHELLDGVFAASVASASSVEDPRPATFELAPGTQVSRYLIGARLGAGGMGVVHAAHDSVLHRWVAIKLLRPDRSSLGEERVMREARALARLSHPNVVTVFDVGAHLDHTFIAMEMVDGGSLNVWLRQAARSPAEIIDRLIEAGRGLAAAHTAGVVHRDVKPDNILVGRDDRARVTDFGLAIGDASSTQKQASALAGTPAYMAPEHLLRRESTPKTDQWSFSATLYEALAGARPFVVDDLAARAAAIADGRLAAPLPGRRVPGWVRKIVLRGLHADPAARWPSMDALVSALARGRQRRHTIAIPAAIAVAVLLVVVAVLGRELIAGGERTQTISARNEIAPLDLAQSTRLGPEEVLGGDMREIAAAMNRDGRLEIFAHGADKIWHIKQTVAGGPWDGWERLGELTGRFSEITTASNDDGRLEIFAVGADQTLHSIHQARPGGSWTSWTSLGEGMRGIATGMNHGGRLELFAIGADETLQHTAQTKPGGPWGEWSTLGGGMSKIAAASNKDGRLEVFVVGADKALHHTYQLTPGGLWSGWWALRGGMSKIAPIANYDGRLEVFVIGADEALHHIRQDTPGGIWSAWSRIGGRVSEVTAARNRDGRLEVFAIDPDLRLNHIWQTTPVGAWSAWASLGSGYVKVATATDLDGRIHVAAIRADGAVTHISQADLTKKHQSDVSAAPSRAPSPDAAPNGHR